MFEMCRMNSKHRFLVGNLFVRVANILYYDSKFNSNELQWRAADLDAEDLMLIKQKPFYGTHG